MKLLNVGMQNFRGTDNQKMSLSGIDIITGSNGVGKTRFLQAVQLAIMGNVPHPIEDRNIDKVEMLTRKDGIDNMMVSVETSGKRISRIDRKFDLKRSNGKDSVNQSIALYPTTEKSVTECERKIKDVFGDFPYMLDIHKFIRLSDAERAKLIFEFCPVSDQWTKETLIEKITDTLLSTDPWDKLYLETIDKELSAQLTGRNISAMIVNALNYLKQKESDLKKEAKNNQNGSSASLQNTHVDGKSALRHVQDILADIDEYRKKQNELTERIAQARATKQAIDRLDEEKKHLVSQIEMERSLVKPENIELLRNKIAEENGQLIAFPPEIKEKNEKDLSELHAIHEEIPRMNLKHSLVQAKIDELVKKKELFKSGVCYACGQSVHGVLENFDEEYQSLMNDLSELGSQIDELNRKRAALDEAIMHDVKNLRYAEAENARHHEEINKLLRQIAEIDGRSIGLKALEKRLDELNHTSVDGDTLNIDEAVLQHEALGKKLETLTIELNEKQTYDTRILMVKELAMKAKRNEELLEMVKAIISTLTEVRWSIVREALEPVKQDAGRLFRFLGYNAEFDFQFQDTRGNEVFKFGWKISTPLGESFVDFDSLSTAQQIFTIVSLLAPLINLGNPDLRLLILDNCEVIHESYRPMFIDLLAEAKSKFLDNIIIASSATFPSAEGVTIHRLNGAAA